MTTGFHVAITSAILAICAGVPVVAQSGVTNSAQAEAPPRGSVSGTPEAPGAQKVDFGSTPVRGAGSETAPEGAASDSSSSTSAAPPATGSATVAPSVKQDAVIQELTEMKKQFDQLNQMQAAIKARMEKLESAMETDDSKSADAEKDASALRAAESGEPLAVAERKRCPHPRPLRPLCWRFQPRQLRWASLFPATGHGSITTGTRWTAPWRPSTSRRSSAPTRITPSITTIRKTTRWVGRRRHSVPTNGSWSRSPSEATSASTTCAAVFFVFAADCGQ